MDFALSEELEMIRDSAREYAERVLKPQAGSADAAEQFSVEVMQEAAEAGFMGLTVPEEFGGAGLGNLHAAVMLEEINRWDPSIGVTLSVHISLACNSLNKWGSDAAKAKYLPRLASGEIIGAYCLTEPQAGSDAAAVRTKAEKVDGGWKISGTKSWITTGEYAGLYVVYAVTDPDAPRGRNMGAFLIEREMDGVIVGKKELKLGLRASSTTEMIFENVFVPDENMLGVPGQGFKIALDTLDGGRIGIASQALGIHRACLEESIQYSKDRKQFGKPIGEFQGVAWKLADMATALEANRMLVHKAAWLRDLGQPCTKECSMAKLAASRACNVAAQDAVQIHGGAGYTKEFPVERHYRDARITEIYEGATDIQRLVISRHL
ncbi:MAG: acyl-CoA dehydrogenase family protein [Planctomycetes bacterium]|nr:acyl-CoA dehydrogenase family protein [Planctomycetota bacterium]NQU50788.1 acyl-CoA dehydrogenase family protein [Planctomycetota bacterium]